LFVVENGTYEVTGNQPIPGRGRVDFAAMARAAGFARAERFDDPTAYARELPGLLDAAGPTCVVVAVAAGNEGPLARGDGQPEPYLRVSLAESARLLRSQLTRA
jgi:hypothetical protein